MSIDFPIIAFYKPLGVVKNDIDRYKEYNMKICQAFTEGDTFGNFYQADFNVGKILDIQIILFFIITEYI